VIILVIIIDGYLAITFQTLLTVDSLHGVCVYIIYTVIQRNSRVYIIRLQQRKDFRNLCRTSSRTVFVARTRRRLKRLNTHIRTHIHIKFIHFTPYLYALFIISPLRHFRRQTPPPMCVYVHLQYDFFP